MDARGVAGIDISSVSILSSIDSTEGEEIIENVIMSCDRKLDVKSITYRRVWEFGTKRLWPLIMLLVNGSRGESESGRLMRISVMMCMI